MDSQARSRVLPAAARPRSSRGEFSVLGLFHSLSLACACPSPQSRLHGRTFKFAERVRRNPPGGGRVLPANPCGCAGGFAVDRKSTRLNSSHGYISYAVFCLKKKKNESRWPTI